MNLKSDLYIRKAPLGFKGLSVIISIELKAMRTNASMIWSSLLSPILYFFFYSIGIQATFGNVAYAGRNVSFLTYSLIGIMAMQLFRQMYQCVYRVVIDKRWGLLSMKILNGVHPAAYVVGISTIPLVGTLIQSIALYTAASVYGETFPLSSFLYLLLFLVFCVLFWSSVLVCVAISIRDYQQRDFILNMLLLPVMFTAPIFYVFDGAPPLIRTISAFNPLTYQLKAMRNIAFGLPNSELLGANAAATVLLFIVSSYFISRADYSAKEY